MVYIFKYQFKLKQGSLKTYLHDIITLCFHVLLASCLGWLWCIMYSHRCMLVMLQTAVDSAIGMNDQAVIVDILNILLQKPYVSSRLSG